MTPEQKQLEEIRKQLASYDAYYPSDPDLWPAALKNSIEATRFLLSLVKEQEAGSNPDFIATARRIVEAHVHETRAAGHTDCDACLDADANAIAATATALSDAATATRSACVEKVKALPDHSTDCNVHLSRVHVCSCSFRREAIRALETLSIEQPKE